MGCDYYTWIETVIQYTDASGNQSEYKEKPEFEEYERHYCFGSPDYDPDFDDPPEDELVVQIRQYGVKTLYADGAWRCKESGKQRILEICCHHDIPVASLTRVFKQMDGYWR
jgi:hypothetical protein